MADTEHKTVRGQHGTGTVCKWVLLGAACSSGRVSTPEEPRAYANVPVLHAERCSRWQARYMLGDAHPSFTVGTNGYPQKPAHKGASCAGGAVVAA